MNTIDIDQNLTTIIGPEEDHLNITTYSLGRTREDGSTWQHLFDLSNYMEENNIDGPISYDPADGNLMFSQMQFLAKEGYTSIANVDLAFLIVVPEHMNFATLVYLKEQEESFKKVGTVMATAVRTRQADDTLELVPLGTTGDFDIKKDTTKPLFNALEKLYETSLNQDTSVKINTKAI